MSKFTSVAQKLLIFLFLVLTISLIIQFGWYAKKSRSQSSLLQKRVQGSNFFLESGTNPFNLPIPATSSTIQLHTSSNNEVNDVQPTPSPMSTPPNVSNHKTQKFLDSQTAHHFLVVVILSKHKERRNAIRETWKSTHYHRSYYNEGMNFTVKFSLGTFGLNSTELKDLEAEEMEHHDLILLPHLKDTYHNLTRKTLYSFEWVDQHLNYSYLFKCDDDSFALLDRMAYQLAKIMSPDKGLYWGYFVGNAWPKTEGAWAEKSWFACDTYMPYAYGGGYVLSANVVHGIVQISDVLTIYNSEDVSMGVWTASFDIERKHDIRFDVQEISRGCLNDFIVVHKQSIEDMYSKHKLLLTKNVLCEKEQLHFYYVYNWTKRPTKCCRYTNRKKRRH